MNDMPMVWVVPTERMYDVRNSKRPSVMLVVALLSAMAAAEVLFLNYVAGPDSVAMMMAAEGVVASD